MEGNIYEFDLVDIKRGNLLILGGPGRGFFIAPTRTYMG